MTLTPHVLSAASIVSSVVIIFTARTAFGQIAQMRSADHIHAFWAVVDRRSLPETAASRVVIIDDAPPILRVWPDTPSAPR